MQNFTCVYKFGNWYTRINGELVKFDSFADVVRFYNPEIK